MARIRPAVSTCAVFQIRDLQLEDREALGAMLDAADYPTWAEDYRRWQLLKPAWRFDPAVHASRILIAVDGESVIGVIEGRPPRDHSEETWGRSLPAPHGWIDRLVVARERRHQGIATALVDAYSAWIAERGAGSVATWVFEGEPETEVVVRRAFFASYGFRQLGDPDHYIMGGPLTDRPDI